MYPSLKNKLEIEKLQKKVKPKSDALWKFLKQRLPRCKEVDWKPDGL